MILLGMVRSIMSKAELHFSFWGYALETSIFMTNKMPSKLVEKTSYKMWDENVSNMSFLKSWQCKTYVKRMTSGKVESKSDKCVFIGYPKEAKGYYFHHKFRHAVFLKIEFFQEEVVRIVCALKKFKSYYMKVKLGVTEFTNGWGRGSNFRLENRVPK